MKKTASVALLSLLVAAAAPVFADSGLPCGMDNDALAAAVLHEYVGSIERAMGKIEELMSDPESNAMALVGALQCKQKNAKGFCDVVTCYFMGNLCPEECDAAEYVAKLALLHKMQVQANAVRKSSDMAEVEALGELVGQLEAMCGVEACAGDAAAAAPASPEDAIMATINQLKESLFGGNVEGLLDCFSEDFSHYEVPDKQTLADFVEMGVDMGYLDQIEDANAEMYLDDAEIEFDGDEAIVYPIDVSADMGAVTLELVFKKDEDGKWRILTADVEGI